jgi:hypothetical protein
MGTWGVGPFDNDAARDLLSEIEQAAPADRVNLIRQALTAAVAAEGYLDYDDAAAAVAAAALLAAAGDGEPPTESVALPLDLPADLAPLAARALDRVTGRQSEWLALWEEGPNNEEALEIVEHIRLGL